MQSDVDTGYSMFNADALSIPVLVSVPHAGRNYPIEIFDNLRIPRESLLRLEDRYADLLAKAVIAAGVPTIIAQCARAWIDLNRDETDCDSDMIAQQSATYFTKPSAKQKGGLGLIPRRLSGEGEIWKKPIIEANLIQRIESYHRPYHAQIEEILTQMQCEFGGAILLDLHSMPPLSDQFSTIPPQFVIGDRYGRSAANRFAEMLMARLRQENRPCALNHPYSGDYILNRHGNVHRNIHAIQLEVDRSLYLDPHLREPTEAVKATGALIADLVFMLSTEFGAKTLLAAE
jgi:N-formylglutamate amidohydrolase